jgi:hypothetical protein
MARPASVELASIGTALGSTLESQLVPRPGESIDLASSSAPKTWSFYMSILLLGLVGFAVALDATSLIVALPVSIGPAYSYDWDKLI